MRKLFLALAVGLCSMNISAQVMKVMKGETVVATYNASTVDKVTFDVQSQATTGTATRTGGEQVTWVQLWKDGPKFATYNVGATAPSGSGYYLAWGGIKDKTNDALNCRDILTGNNDSATYFWGSNWRTPTYDELDKLRNADYCSIEDATENGVKGYKITGVTEGYTSNSIFLPGASRWIYSTNKKDTTYTESAFYWSSKPNIVSNAWNGGYRLGIDHQRWSNMSANTDGMCVRPVLAE